MSDKRRIRTILYGDQLIYATELDLLHTPMMQRLYDLHQLGLTDRIFIDASHSRLHHTIGVLVQVDNILNAIKKNLDSTRDRVLRFRDSDGRVTRVQPQAFAGYIGSRHRAVRLMGMLHDLTHAPFGHTLEDEIDLQPVKHDEPARQAEAFYRLLVQYLGWLRENSGDATNAAEEEYPEGFLDTIQTVMGSASEVAPPESDSFIDALIHLGTDAVNSDSLARRLERAPGKHKIIALLHDMRFAMRALLWLDALHGGDAVTVDEAGLHIPGKIDPDGSYAFENVIDGILAYVGESQSDSELPLGLKPFWLPRDALFLDVIGNTICADLLDYARRDSHHAGLRLDYDVERIVDTFTVVSYSKHQGGPGGAITEPMVRTAISIFTHKLRLDVPGELMNLLQVRFYVYQRVLYHPTKAIAGAMLGSALQLLGWRQLPAEFAYLGDAVFLDRVGEVANFVFPLVDGTADGDQWSMPVSSIADGPDGLLARLASMPACSLVSIAMRLLEDRRTDSIGEVLTDWTAARRLLARLAARRYNKAVFRLLPDVKVSTLQTGPEHIAAFFREPVTRAKAEREIEGVAKLPRGTVTIHCPNSAGPRKIAEILILSGKGEADIVPLRDLSKIEPPIFEKHGVAIRAVEDMYLSMWRLVVSVSPPYHARYETLSPVIGRVLYRVLNRDEEDANRAVPNDPRQLLELAGLAGLDDTIERIDDEEAVSSVVTDVAQTPSSDEALPLPSPRRPWTTREIRRAASDLLNRYPRQRANPDTPNITIVPVDVERIIRDVQGLSIEEVAAIPTELGETGAIEGRFEPAAKRILLLSGAAPARRRYTLAHELGHAVLHDMAAARGLSYDRAEREADLFAAELLMPELEVKRFFSDRYGLHRHRALTPALFRGTPNMPLGRFNTLQEFAAFVVKTRGPHGEPSFEEVFGVSSLAAERRIRRDLKLLRLS